MFALQDSGRAGGLFRRGNVICQCLTPFSIRRIIAYYEGETKHPPTTILPKLAVALGVTSDALLNAKSKKGNNSSPISSPLQRKLRQIEKLGTKEKRQAMQLLDMFIEREQLKNKTMKVQL